MNIPDIAILTAALGVLVILTNAITEVVKNIIPKLPAQFGYDKLQEILKLIGGGKK